MRRIVQLALVVALGLVLGQAALAQETKNGDSTAPAATPGSATVTETAAPVKDKAAPANAESANKEAGSTKKVDISISDAKETSGTTKTASQEPAAAAPAGSLYTINSDAEFGWRFKASDGNLDQFRSDLNYDKGPRLFSSSLYMRNNTGVGLFDTLIVDAFGFGGDPSQYLKADIEKTKWYRIDANYRRFDYFNDLSNYALGQHTADLQYQVGDFDLTLFPRNPRFKLYLGYSMDYFKGTQFTTYDFSRNEFPLFAPTRTSANNYRVGFDATVGGFDLSFLQGFRYSKDDTQYLVTGPEGGNEAGITPSNLATFLRDVPTRGRTPFTRLSVHRRVGKRVDFTARVIYTSATTHYTLFEDATGTDLLGRTLHGDITNVTGNAKKPNAIGDGAITIYATDKLTISDAFRVNSFRINGGDIYNEAVITSTRGVPNPTQLINTLAFQFIGEHLYQNTIEANYDFSTKLQVHGGYRFTHRDINLGNFTIPPGGGLQLGPTTDNNTNSGFFGFRVRPVQIWTTYFDVEHGSADNVFTRVANYDFTNVRVRTLIKPTKTLAINASLITKNNSNPAVTDVAFAQNPFGVDISSRTFSTSVDWTPSSRLLLSGGYTYNHLDSDAAIIFFLNFAQTLGSSQYFVRDHFFFINSRVQFSKRVSAFGAFRINKDLGQGDRVSTGPAQILTSYPLRYSDPEARITINLNRHVDWNAGWQYFDYAEALATERNFRVHLAYVSLTLRFNRE